MKSLKTLNYFKHPILLNYNGNVYKTYYGGIFSLLISIIVLLYAIDKIIVSTE